MRRNNPDMIQCLLLIFNFGHRILIWTLFLKKCGQTNFKISKYYRINGLAIFVNN